MTTPNRLCLALLVIVFGFVLQRCSQPDPTGPDSSASNSSPSTIRHPESGEKLPLYPQLCPKHPGMPSPWRSESGIEIVVAHAKDGRFALVPVTVENGPPIDWPKRRFTKGKQLEVDREDFPALANTGLHDDEQLEHLTAITGKSLDEITRRGRPKNMSHSGFLAEDEDIISVLKGDNALVSSLGLTHPQMARPLFHVWNVILLELQVGKGSRLWDHISAIEYNGKTIHIKAQGTRGFQESLFNDEIRGTASIDLWRELAPNESAFLNDKYADLSKQQMDELVNKLTRIHTGEMEPYYVKRYGFYEGHTEWRVDPVAIAFVFGLKSLEQIESAFPGKLYDTLTGHFTAR